MNTGGAPGGKRYGRRSDKPRKPRDAGMFQRAIHDAAEALDFSLRMYAVELGQQLWTEDEITAELQRAFRKSANQILDGLEPRGETAGHGEQSGMP